MQQVMTAICKK